jgi:hypothetical protein
VHYFTLLNMYYFYCQLSGRTGGLAGPSADRAEQAAGFSQIHVLNFIFKK